jgi:hypothetical protein
MLSKNSGHRLSLRSSHQDSLATPLFLSVFLSAATVAISTIGMSQPAEALPSFARQTGQPCGACHTDFPSLTPFGRQFKLGGYTLGGGDYRTTLFPTGDDATKALADYAKKDDKAKSDDKTKAGSTDTGTGDTWVPPISMMTIVGFTHTQADQDPTGSPYHANNNVAVSPVSFFYGGAITEHVGAFAQVTYNGSPFGAPDAADPFATFQWSWDNVDVRYANTAKLGDMDVTYGFTGNNNPTVQDPWNTTPAWSFPYAVSSIAPSPGAGTLIDGALAGHVGGAGAYAFINNLVYVELSAYRTLNHDAQTKLGVDPFDSPGISDGVAPYWRIAVEPHWGNHWLEFGAFGMTGRFHPFNATALDDNGYYENVTYAETNRFTDTAVDAQYQYQGDNYWLTLRGSYIHENQTLDAGFANGLSTNPSNTLNTLRAQASFAYGNDNRVVLTGQYFDTWGSSDDLLYAAPDYSNSSPNSDGFTAEIAYIPFVLSKSPVWPWANARVGLQYTYYNKFNGTTENAHDNDTLFAYLWFAM